MLLMRLLLEQSMPAESAEMVLPWGLADESKLRYEAPPCPQRGMLLRPQAHAVEDGRFERHQQPPGLNSD